MDYSLFPERQFQLQWLRCYLASYLSLRPAESPQPADHSVQPTDRQVETLYVQVSTVTDPEPTTRAPVADSITESSAANSSHSGCRYTDK